MAQSNSSLTPCYVETAPGIEEVAWLEIRERFPRANFREFLYAKDERGVVVFDFPGSVQQLFSLRVAERFFLNITFMEKVSRGYRDLKALRETLMHTGDLGRAVNTFTRFRRRQPSTYHLVVRKYGRHQYNVQDVREVLLTSMNVLYPDWQRVTAGEGAEVELWVNVFGSSILVGLRLPPPARVERPPEQGALSASIVAALVRLTEPAADDIFLDPLCGEGVLLLERTSLGGAAATVGAAPSFTALQMAQRRLQEEAPGDATLLQAQPEALPLTGGSVHKVASHWPGEDVDAYGEWLGALARVLRPGGRGVILTTAYDPFRDAIRAYPALEIRRGYSVRVGRSWGRIYIVHHD